MKLKRIMWICILCILFTPTIVYAKSVAVTIPEFPVTVNDQVMENLHNQYPLLLYKDITYFPMAYDYASFLGVKANWYKESFVYDKSVLFVGVAENRTSELKISSTNIPNKRRYNANVVEYGIALNTTNPKKYLNNLKEEYPILNFRGVTYFPMTWRFAVEEFGWKYSYEQQSGLRIESGNPFRPIINDRIIGSSMPQTSWLDYYYGKDYYVGYNLPFDCHSKIIVRKRGEQEREFDLETQIQGMYSFNVRKNSAGVFVESEPSITNNIFSVECAKNDPVTGESIVFLLKINLDSGKAVTEEVQP